MSASQGREIGDPEVQAIWRLHTDGWTDQEMAEGRWPEFGGPFQPGLPGEWTRFSVRYWRRKLGLPANRRCQPRGLRGIAGVRATCLAVAGLRWRHALPEGSPPLSAVECEVLDALWDAAGPLPVREIARRLGRPPHLWHDGNSATGRLLRRGLIVRAGRKPGRHGTLTLYGLAPGVQSRRHDPWQDGLAKFAERLAG